MYTAFFQEIRYELPPDLQNGKQIMGLWVPTEVLINHHGDCDSKSLALAAMLKPLGIRVVVIRIPGHVLLGVEGTPGPDQKFVRIGNHYFILCEVAGPAKRYPGEEGSTPVSGSFEYTMVEPGE